MLKKKGERKEEKEKEKTVAKPAKKRKPLPKQELQEWTEKLAHSKVFKGEGKKKKRPITAMSGSSQCKSRSKGKLFSKESSKDHARRNNESPSKVSINFEIGNLNIFSKVLHKKSASCLNEGRVQKPKDAPLKKHRITKSQDDIPSGFKPLAVEDVGQSIIANHFAKSKAGLNSCSQEKINQDAMIELPTFTASNRALFGVCDGHGTNGHLIARFVKEILPENLEFFMIKNKVAKRAPIDEHLGTQCLRQSFSKTGNDLLDNPIDINYSGSTAVVTLFCDNRLWCANIGDSRAVLYSRSATGWRYKALSNDHKAELPGEARRIIGNNGRVQPFRDQEGNQLGPYRVWLKNESVPGLAMTRSFGDYVASTVGVICEPEVVFTTLCREDKFLVVASDGLWEFMSNEEVLQSVEEFYMRNDARGGCERLIEAATLLWHEQDEVVDDITVQLLFLSSY